MADQCAVAAAWLGEGAHPAQMRDERPHRCKRCRVEVPRDSLEVGTLAHVVLGMVVTGIRPARCSSWLASGKVGKGGKAPLPACFACFPTFADPMETEEAGSRPSAGHVG